MSSVDLQQRPVVADVAGDLDAELNDVAGHINAQHGRLVDLTIRILADKSEWQGPGVWTAEQFLAWRVGIAPGRARQIVDIARRADELPVCVDALRRGELSIDQVAPIAKRAPWWTDNQICGLAKNLTVTQIRRVASQYKFPTIPKPVTDDGNDARNDDTESDTTHAPQAELRSADDSLDTTAPNAATASGDADAEVDPAVDFDPAPQRDACWFYLGDDDRFRLNLETDALTGKLIETALAEARDTLFRNGTSNIDWVDAFRELAERSLDAVTEPSRRERFRIGIHIDTEATATDAVGWRLPDAIRRHLTCDGVLDPVFLEGGRPVSVGRRQRIVPERTRRLVMLRDQGCRVPGCTNHRYLEVHHIIHWIDHGPTDTWNLICLCPHHHRLHHQGKLGIAGDADVTDSIDFIGPTGAPFALTGARPEPPGAPPPQPAGIYDHPIGERLQSRWLYFNPPPAHRN